MFECLYTKGEEMKDKNFDEMEFITELYTFDDVLSTIDNPYHPLEEFDSWYQYDTEQIGRASCRERV